MRKYNKGILQVSLVIFLASIIAGYVVIRNVDFSSVAAKASKYWQTQWDKCPISRLCKGTVGQDYADRHKDYKDPSNGIDHVNCHPDVTEGCLIDYKDTAGNFCYAVRNPSCGHNNEETPIPTPTATPTVTPTPTSTPTSTPIPTPTSTPTSTPTATPTPILTPTQTPPPVLGATAPPRLPKTGSDDVAVFAGLFGIMGVGLAIFRKFKLL